MLEKLAFEVSGIQKNEGDGLVEDEAEDEISMVTEKLECLSRAKYIFKTRGCLCKAGRKAFSSFHGDLRGKKVASMKQTTIYNHFKTN